MYSPIDIFYCGSKEDVISANLGVFKCVRDLDRDILIENSKKYCLDFKIYVFESGEKFNMDFEVSNGCIIKDDIIKFDDYTFECIDPELGGSLISDIN